MFIGMKLGNKVYSTITSNIVVNRVKYSIFASDLKPNGLKDIIVMKNGKEYDVYKNAGKSATGLNKKITEISKIYNLPNSTKFGVELSLEEKELEKASKQRISEREKLIAKTVEKLNKPIKVKKVTKKVTKKVKLTETEKIENLTNIFGKFLSK